MRNLTADRQAQTCSTVLPRDRPIRLLKCLKDDLVFVRRNSDAGIDYRKSKHLLCLVKDLMTGSPPFVHVLDAKSDASLFRKFERVRQ